MTAAEWLLERAESYGRDASVLSRDEPAAAVIYRTISSELRRCAVEITKIEAAAC